jgi:hypothetical protein
MYYGTGSSVYIQNGQSTQRILARAGCGTRTPASSGSLLMFLLWQPKQGPLSRIIVGENKTAEGEQDAVVCLYGIRWCKSELAWTRAVRICMCFRKYREKESLKHQPMLFMDFKRAPQKWCSADAYADATALGSILVWNGERASPCYRPGLRHLERC